MHHRLRYGLLAGCLGLIALHARDGARAWTGGAPALVRSVAVGPAPVRTVATGTVDPDPFGSSEARSDTVALDSFRPSRPAAQRVARGNDLDPTTEAQTSR